MFFYCELIFVCFTMSYATCIFMKFLYGGDLVGKQFSMKNGVPNNVENLLNMESATYDLSRGERTGAR